MAQRGEGQGLQIAVISFAMLTIILAITTYIFYAQSQTAQKDLEAKTKALNDKQMETNKLLYRVRAMQYVLGAKSTAMADVEQAKGQAGGDDAEVKEILDNFGSDSVAIGDQVVPEGNRSYRTINAALLAALNKKNASASDAIEESRKAQLARDKAQEDGKTRAETAEAASNKAAEDLKAQAAAFAADRTTLNEEKDKLATQLTSAAANAKRDLQKVIDEKDLYAKQNSQILTTNKTILSRLEEARKHEAGLKENPDGYIKRVDQGLRMVWIDVGRADGLLRQTTFDVYDHNENGVVNAKYKARIEVVNVGDHLSEARILEDSPKNPIISGDIINTPAWSPGQRIHFALAMKMDINKDGIDDYDLVKNIITMNGGVIDAELRPDGTRVGNINVNTRYFVEGERPSDATSPELQKQYNAFDGDRERFSVPKISVHKLLSLMGWKAEERTVELAGDRAGTSFRKPMAKKAAAGVAPTEGGAPATESAPAAPTADPFGAPAGAAPAPAPADPFAAPGAAPAADPFAPK